MLIRILSLLVIFCININVYALRCYTCSATQDGTDQRCVTSPETVEGNPITNCNKRYCTVTRVEYIDPRNKIQSMSRDCVDRPIKINQIAEDSTYRIYYKACQTDLCNSGSGKDFSNAGLNGDDGEAIVLLVEGIGVLSNSASSLFRHTHVPAVLLFITVYRSIA